MPFGVSWIDDLRHYATAEIRTAFDIGAHHGETAQLIGAAFPEVEVHCFEPVRPNYRTLLKATSALPVTCVQAAVSDQDGTARFHLGPDSGRCGFRATGPGLDVRTVTLDSYARERGISHIDLLKIDTEGHEPAVLRGARELLAAGGIDFVLAECEFTERPEEPHGDFAQIVSLLVPAGFRVISFYTGGVDALGWRWGDVLFARITATEAGPVAVSPV